MPATNVLANVYQLYMVLYQCASILISHNQGIEDITVNAKTTINKAAHTVLFQIYFFPSSTLSMVYHPGCGKAYAFSSPAETMHTIVIIVQTAKNPLFKNPDFHCKYCIMLYMFCIGPMINIMIIAKTNC